VKHEDNYAVHALLRFSWYDTCWGHRIWRVGTFWFCFEYGIRENFEGGLTVWSV